MIGAARYFAPRYFAPRYWPKVGEDPSGDAKPWLYRNHTFTMGVGIGITA